MIVEGYNSNCDCCDHPLEHIIRMALNAAENVPAATAIRWLKDDYESWKDEQ